MTSIADSLEDLVARPLEKEEQTGGVFDRQGTHWLIFDVDGTRQAARQRALPRTPDLPPAPRRLDKVCEPFYTGRKRGELVRTRTTILQAHTHQWIGTYIGAGNGDYRDELRRAVKGIGAYMKGHAIPLNQAVIRLDGQYGNGAILADVAELSYVMRGKHYGLLDFAVTISASGSRTVFTTTTNRTLAPRSTPKHNDWTRERSKQGEGIRQDV